MKKLTSKTPALKTLTIERSELRNAISLLAAYRQSLIDSPVWGNPGAAQDQLYHRSNQIKESLTYLSEVFGRE